MRGRWIMGERSNADVVRSVLVRTRLFAGCGEEALEALLQASELRNFDDGETVTAYGDPASKIDGVWIVGSGSLETGRTWANGKRIVFSFLQGGQVTGLMPVLDGLPGALDVTARGPTTLVRIPGRIFIETLKRHPLFALSVMEMMSRRNRLDYDRLESQSLNSSRVFVAKTLFYLGRAVAPEGASVTVPVKVSQEDVAGILGVTRQQINKEITWFIREGILERHYRGVVIADIGKLLAVINSEEPLNEFLHQVLLPAPSDYYRTSD